MNSSCWRFLDCKLGKHRGCCKFFSWKSRSVQQYHPGGQAEYFWLPRQDNCRNIVPVVVVVKGGKISEDILFLVISANDWTKLLSPWNLKFGCPFLYFLVWSFPTSQHEKGVLSLQNQAISKLGKIFQKVKISNSSFGCSEILLPLLSLFCWVLFYPPYLSSEEKFRFSLKNQLFLLFK